MTKKQYYIPGKGYERTKDEKQTLLKVSFDNAPDDATHYCPEVAGEVAECWVKYANNKVFYSYHGNGYGWYWSDWDDYKEVEHHFIPRSKKENLSAEDLEVGKEYVLHLGVNDCRNVIYWGKNAEVIFVTELLYHTYAHFFIENIFRIEEVSVKIEEEEISEKYGIPLDTVVKMLQDGLIKTD